MDVSTLWLLSRILYNSADEDVLAEKKTCPEPLLVMHNIFVGSHISTCTTLINFRYVLTVVLSMTTVEYGKSKALCFRTVHPPRTLFRLCVLSSGRFLLPWCLVNGLSNFDETYREYLLSPTDDLIRFWRSKVKVIAGCRGGEGIRFNDGASKSNF